jgi:hypothetical protein
VHNAFLRVQRFLIAVLCWSTGLVPNPIPNLAEPVHLEPLDALASRHVLQALHHQVNRRQDPVPDATIARLAHLCGGLPLLLTLLVRQSTECGFTRLKRQYFLD